MHHTQRVISPISPISPDTFLHLREKNSLFSEFPLDKSEKQIIIITMIRFT